MADAAPLHFAGMTLHGRIGLGGSAEVWHGRLADGREVACKRLLPHLRADGRARGRMQREVGALAALDGAVTPALLAADVAATVPWLATALVQGPTWKALRALPPDAALQAVLGLWWAVATLHGLGWLHLDLAPGNVIVDRANARTSLLDLGLALPIVSPTDASGSTGAQPTPLGMPTPAFASPEALRCSTLVPGSDVYAAATLSHWLLAGALPFGQARGPALAAWIAAGAPPTLLTACIDAAIGPESRALLSRCWAADAQARPSAAEVVASFEATAPMRRDDATTDALHMAVLDWRPQHGGLPGIAAEDRDESVTGDDDLGAARAAAPTPTDH